LLLLPGVAVRVFLLARLVAVGLIVGGILFPASLLDGPILPVVGFVERRVLAVVAPLLVALLAVLPAVDLLRGGLVGGVVLVQFPLVAVAHLVIGLVVGLALGA